MCVCVCMCVSAYTLLVSSRQRIEDRDAAKHDLAPYVNGARAEKPWLQLLVIKLKLYMTNLHLVGQVHDRMPFNKQPEF